MNNGFNINIEEDDVDIQINDAIIQGGEIDINLENGIGKNSLMQSADEDEKNRVGIFQDDTRISDFSAESDYVKGSLVRYDSKLYYATTNIEAHSANPDVSSVWQEVKSGIAFGIGNTVEVLGFASGKGNRVYGAYSGAVGRYNIVELMDSFAAGDENHTFKNNAVAIGYKCQARGSNSLATGCRTTTTGDSAVAQGYSNRQCPDSVDWYVAVPGGYEHITDIIDDNVSLEAVRKAYDEGAFTLASRYGSHAKGQNTVAFSQNSTAEGQGTFAFGDCQHAFGKFNDISDSKSQLVRSTGWGTDHTHRKNIEELDRDGTLDIMGMPKTEFSVLTARFMKKYPMLFNCVSFILRNWTVFDWDMYGSLNHDENAWSGTDHLTKEIEGTFFALYGTTFSHTDSSGVSWYKKRIAILRSTGGNPTDPTDSRASGTVIARYDYLKGSNGHIEIGKEDLFKILELE